jgi:hypothetical protein
MFLVRAFRRKSSKLSVKLLRLQVHFSNNALIWVVFNFREVDVIVLTCAGGLIFHFLLIYWRAVIAQSVWRLATGWTISVLGFGSRRGWEFFVFATTSRPALGPIQPPSQWVPRVLSLGVKRPGVKLTTHLHLLLRSKNAWSYTSTPQYVFMMRCSVKAEGHLYRVSWVNSVYPVMRLLIQFEIFILGSYL